MNITSIDYAIIVLYLVGIVGLGIWAGSRRHKSGEGSHYFLEGNTLTRPVIGLAMVAANISTVHLVSLAESTYKYGLIYGNFEWKSGFTIILLPLFFAPLYLRSHVPTLPDGGILFADDLQHNYRRSFKSVSGNAEGKSENFSMGKLA